MTDLKNLPLEEQKRALEWQCRRGIKEIEVMLIPFLENHFEHQEKRVRDAFIDLLEESDLDMFEWFTHRLEPDREELGMIIEVILKSVEPSHES